MNTTCQSALEEAIRDADQGWLIDSFRPPEAALPHIRATLEAVQEEAQNRLGGNAPIISEDVIVAEYRRNPSRMRGFFQALGGTRTPVMLLMVWRILQGMEVKEIQLDYRRQQSFELRIVLESPYAEEDEPYCSSNIHDFALVRHIGTLEVGGAPVFDGFYAMRIGRNV